jgi:hypothetical protein
MPMSKQRPMKAKSTPASASSPPESQTPPNGELIVMSAEEAFAQAQHVGWGPNLPKSDDEIDYSDIPPQDWSGPNVVRGRYRELALAAQGLIALDPDVRRAFPDADAVNRALRGLIEIAKNAQRST